MRRSHGRHIGKDKVQEVTAGKSASRDLASLTCCSGSFPLLWAGQWKPGVQGLKRIGTQSQPATLERHRPTQRYQSKTWICFFSSVHPGRYFLLSGFQRQINNWETDLQNKRIYRDQREKGHFETNSTSREKRNNYALSVHVSLQEQHSLTHLKLRFVHFIWIWCRYLGFSKSSIEDYGVEDQCIGLLAVGQRATLLTVQLLSVGRLVCGALGGISGEQWLWTAW